MEAKLLPCPFCGGEAVEGKVKFGGKESDREGWIGCPACRVFMNYMNGERGKWIAIEAWNTRHERTCEGCIKIGIHDWCEDCARSKPDLYHTTEETDAD